MPLDNTASLSTILQTLEESTLINIKPQMISLINSLAVNNDLPIKTKITNTIGAPALSTDTWDNINTDIQTSKNTLVSNLATLGIGATGTDTLANLVNKVVKDVNLVTGNIISGQTIFGVSGKASVVDTSSANATATQILSGKTGYINGSLVTGTMVNNPTIASQEVANGLTQTSTIGRTLAVNKWAPAGGGAAYLIPSAGYYDGIDTWTFAKDSGLVPANILSGVSIFGVAGTASAIPTTVTSGQTSVLAYSGAMQTQSSTTSLIKLKEIKILASGSVTVTWQSSCFAGITIKSQVYKNGVAQGTTISYTPSTSSLFATHTLTGLSVTSGDLIQIYAACTTSSYTAEVQAMTIWINETLGGAIINS